MINSRKTRRGISLIELAVAITVGATIMMLTIVAFSRLIGTRHGVQDHLQQVAGLGKLAEQFRGDVWAARSAIVERDGAELSLTGDEDRRTLYVIDNHVLSRSTFVGDKRLSHESYQTAGVVARRLAIDTSGAVQRASLELQLTEPSPKSLPIRALVGRDYVNVAVSTNP